MDENYRRVKFNDVFDEKPDGSLSPKVPIEINGVNFNSGTTFSKGVVFGGIDFHLYKNRDIAIQNSEVPEENTDSTVFHIVGFYKE
ncbi:MAG: hypothetical protein A2566_03720 [Candidatus Zambryskibacteria bacterium RIFOXYD1_FULL_40_13]|nr:MAG: hypothetical protein UT25_C0002G0216 [Parcubacteria group bacterium GW2011_GWC1_39_12]KKR19284.1 MAG: hypothetical protein UT49_C0002G0130 [Parcubacteria group bacterium GW2011_GWF1_39_37]KKR35333.1 MAG: hypothetical protein UT68_C0004G0141 [Parcubacteria group bacterium GW2011_GWC2_40_10]KKR52235.1 MAG: hypothetical protein UT89_C0002G0036 [Parcubacteria group bacterium GW2011_GWE1_40_20]KKR65732.1 MAG: hypothetical protein UU06_C0012G0028 [Parcubacteria group bacterium GW2011_GWB1_40_